MVATFRVSLSLVILLVYLDKLSPLAQWIPTTGGNGNFLPPLSSPNSQPNFYSPQPFYPGVADGAAVQYHPDFSGNGASGSSNFATNNHFHNYPNIPNQGFPSQSSTPAASKKISGDYCLEPLFSCDTTNTLLYCIQARCTCPNQWTLAPGNFPLNTVWHPEMRRCVSVLGSGCHILSSTYPKRPLPPPTTPIAAASSAYAYPNEAQTLDHSDSSSATKEIASTIIKGLIGLPTSTGSTGGMGYVFCQPGARCVGHSTGFQEIGICAGTVKNKINSLIFLLTILSVFNLFQT